jgi:hypothetical protein
MPKRPTTTKPKKSELDAAIDSLNSGAVALLDKALHDLSNPVANPLDAVPDTDDAEKDCKGVMSAALSAFKQQAKNEAKIFKDNTDTEFWFAVCFQNREQKDAFLTALDLIQHGDKYLDGQYVAKKLGVELPVVKRKFNTGEVEKSMVAIGTIPPKKSGK